MHRNYGLSPMARARVWSYGRIAVSSVLRGVCFGFGVLVVLGVTALAQSGVLPGRGRGVDGVTRRQNVYEFRTPAGSRAPTVLGIVWPGQPEPMSPEDTGAMWAQCSGPAEATRCIGKINLAGNDVVFFDVTRPFPR